MATGWTAGEEIDARSGSVARMSERTLEPLTEDAEAYPLTAAEVKELGRSYQDEAAAQLYKTAGGAQLTKAHARMVRALVKQAEKLETFHSTPFTTNNVKVLKATISSIEQVQIALAEWHYLIYPNQRKDDA